jgi:predicted peptidase
MKKTQTLIAAILMLISFSSCKHQFNQPADPPGCAPFAERTVVNLSTSGRDSAWLQLPCEYYKKASAQKKYPLLVFLNGIGESGNKGNLDIMVTGPAILMRQNFRFSFRYADSTYDFIVVCPQSLTGFRDAKSTNAVIDYMINTYRVDQSRIYLTGISAGAYSLYNYLTQSMQFTNRIAASAPMSSLRLDDFHRANLKYISDANVAIESFCGNLDDNFTINKEYIDVINSYKPGLATYTPYNGKHCCWNQVYDVSQAFITPNMYEWLLRFHK